MSVAMDASHDQSWLLDKRFADPAATEERELANAARKLFRNIDRAGLSDDPSWGALHAFLQSMGADRQDEARVERSS